MQRIRRRLSPKAVLCAAWLFVFLAAAASVNGQVHRARFEVRSAATAAQNAVPTPIPRPVGNVEYTEACLRVPLLGAPVTYRVIADHVSRVGTRLQFRLESNRHNSLILTYVEDEELASMFLIGGNLIATVGYIGDHSVLRIFHLEETRVTVVFNCAVKGDPDFVWGPGEASEAETVLTYTGRSASGNYNLPSKAEIYVWNGRVFRLKACVPYRDRFRALARMEEVAHN